MIKLLKNADVYAPAHLGVRDILIAGEKIVAVEPRIEGYEGLQEVEVFDLQGARLAPGLIDLHVHITGGGGEQGPTSRVPELSLSTMTFSGVTTVLAPLGTDGITRSKEALLAKTRALNEEGITCYCLTGSYQYPSVTLLGSVDRDVALLDPVVGVKVALADHRSAGITTQELIRLGAEARMGGLVGGKPGLVVLHMGGGKEAMARLIEAVTESDIPVKTFLPTHCERNARVTQGALAFTRMGGMADFTADIDGSKGGTAKTIDGVLRQGMPLTQITMSSDGGGSQPRFDASGNCIGMDVGMPNTLLDEVRRLMENHGWSLSDALCLLTANPARALGKEGVKGTVAQGADADLLVFDDALHVATLFARGRLMVNEGRAVVTGKFEK